jgi:hypothetical protein
VRLILKALEVSFTADANPGYVPKTLQNREQMFLEPDLLSVRDVRFQGHQLLRDCLVEIDLTGADSISRRNGTIVVQDPVGVHLDVDVNSTLDIETRNNCRVIRFQISQARGTCVSYLSSSPSCLQNP